MQQRTCSEQPSTSSMQAKTLSARRPSSASGVETKLKVVIGILTIQVVLIHFYQARWGSNQYNGCNDNHAAPRLHRQHQQQQQQQLQHRGKHEKRKKASTLVVYSGPTKNKKSSKLDELYRKNLEHFLRHGIECSTQDTIVAVGHDYYDEYVARVEALDDECPHRVILVARRNACYDMEAVRLAFYGGVPGIDVTDYDHFLFANCGTTGPPPRTSIDAPPWTERFTSLLDDKVKMTGLSLNCENGDYRTHIMSMMYALDREGIELVRNSGAVYDCIDPPDSIKKPNDFINLYEREMGRVILGAGYALRTIVGGDLIVFKENLLDCAPCEGGESGTVTQGDPGVSCMERERYRDVWIGSRLTSIYGRMPSLEDVVFLKTSRVFPREVADLINYTGVINWEWK